jgi:hypothetical protein
MIQILFLIFKVLVEDVFERSVQLCKQCLHEVVYPNTDYIIKTQFSKLRKSFDSSFIKKQINSRSVNISQLYKRLIGLLRCFSELVCYFKRNNLFINIYRPVLVVLTKRL